MFLNNISQQNLSYISVTMSYWLFMLTDGALRIIILFNFHLLGFSPLDLAYLFLVYELMGIVTNLLAGWIAARFGLNITLYGGLIIQICALSLLLNLNNFDYTSSKLIFTIFVYGLSGIAKDLVKMSAKSSVKLIVNENQQSKLFKWVSTLTGSKNAVKGLGFFLGGALMSFFNFKISIIIMTLCLIILILFLMLSKPIIQNKKIRNKQIKLFSKSKKINYLSFSRIFLFGARDIWFVVSLPIFLYETLRNFDITDSKAFFLVGGFLALWVIFYGITQAFTPKIINISTNNVATLIKGSKIWFLRLLFCSAIISIISFFLNDSNYYVYFLIFGLFLFGILFAVNSSLHSFFILAFSNKINVTLDVGFYYMSNATGRFVGTLLSGLTYQYFGIVGALFCSTIFILVGLFYFLKLEN